MPGRKFTGKRWFSLGLFLSLFVALAACGGHSTVHLPPAPTATSTGLTLAAPTATPDKTRIPYPWPMKQHQVPLSTNVVWVPTDARVYQELEKDFLTFWTWSGQAGPASFPFLPDSTQITLLATPDFSGQLQNYVAQVQSSGQVTAYLSAARTPIQTLKSCTQDGLQCQCNYVFSSTTKTVYDTNTGNVHTQTANLQVVVSADQSYNREMQRWQLSNITIQEVPA